MSKEIEVVWWGGQRGSWCHGIVEWLTQGFTHRMDVKELQGNGAIVVTKADWMKTVEEVKQFHFDTVRLEWLLLLITANEEGLSPLCTYQRTGKFKKWLQTPHRHQTCDVALPWGFTPGCSVEVHSKKDLEWSFAGQITHPRRQQFLEAAVELMRPERQWEFHGSNGFAKGISQAEYYTLIGRSKVVPCPSGPMTVDSFRVCEALQLGAVPILDGASPRGPYPEYWNRVFGKDFPLFVIEEWEELPFILEEVLGDWETIQKDANFWWQKYKAGLHAKMMVDLHDLGAM